MTPFQRKPARPPSKISQFIRFLMLGLCVGVGLAIISVSIAGPVMMRFTMDGNRTPNLAVTILLQLLSWADVLLLAPAAAYVAGRIFLSHKWKFVFSMFVGLKFFSFGLVLIDVVGVSLMDILLDGTALILGFALSIIMFGRGVKAGSANQNQTEGAPAAAATPAVSASRVKEIPVPQTLSKIDFTAVASRLNQEAAEGSSADSSDSANPPAAAEDGSGSQDAAPSAGESSSPSSDNPSGGASS